MTFQKKNHVYFRRKDEIKLEILERKTECGILEGNYKVRNLKKNEHFLRKQKEIFQKKIWKWHNTCFRTFYSFCYFFFFFIHSLLVL